ncbi:MAG TPA: hypothetical protein VKT73_07210 [Xanthobacteraceae bacterium]|nr:hypothetical protein [Xanthobacteraceae bacterium]
MPNRFQCELARQKGVIAGRRWSCQSSERRRLPVELRPLAATAAAGGQGARGSAAGGFARNDILTSRAQRAFAVLDSAGAWRRLAAEYAAAGDRDRAAACKRAAHEHLFRATRARIEAEVASPSVRNRALHVAFMPRDSLSKFAPLP